MKSTRTPPFCGRAAELEQLGAVLREAEASRGGAVLVCGEPGIGKTRLCSEILDRAAGSGFSVFATRARELMAPVSYAPFAELLRTAVGSVPDIQRISLVAGLTGLGGLLTDIAPRHTTLDEAAEPSQTMEPHQPAVVLDAAIQFFRRLSQLRPVALYLDDAHNADPATLRMLAQLGSGIADRRVLLLVASRTGHTNLDLLRSALLPECWVIDLARLKPATAAQLVHSAQRSPEESARFQRQAAGLPLYLAAVLTELVDSDSLPDHPPAAIRQLTTGLTRSLSGRERLMAELLALADNGAEYRTLLDLWPHDDGCITEIRTLLERGLAERLDGGRPERYRLSHPAYARIISDGLLEPERDGWHRAFIRSLEDSRPSDAPANRSLDALALADHYIQLRHEVPAARLTEVLSQAADCAADDGDDESLIRFLSVWLDGPAAPSEPGELVRRLEQLGAAQHRSGLPTSARSSLERALGAALDGHDAARLDTLRPQLGMVDLEAGAYAASTDSFVRALSLNRGSPEEPAHTAIFTMIWSARYGDPQQALAAADHAITFGQGSSRPADRVVSELGHCMSASVRGRYLDGEAHAQTASELAVAASIPYLHNVATVQIVRVAPLAGDLAAARTGSKELLQTALEYNLPTHEITARIWLAMLEHFAGSLSAAAGQLALAAEPTARSESARVIARAAIVRALLLAEQGDARQARAFLADSQRIYGQGMERDHGLQSCAQLVRSVLALQSRKPERVPDLVEPVWGTYPQAICMLPFLSGQAGVELGQPERVERQIRLLAGVPGQGPVFPALAARLEGLAHAASGRPAAAEEFLARAATELSDAGIRLYAAQARLEWAEVTTELQATAARRDDAPRQAVAELLQYFAGQEAHWWFHRTRRVARRLGMREAAPRTGRLLLTRREMEVAGLVSEGLSNADTAARLFLSERTVESHIRNIYAQLGFHSRLELAQWVARHGEEQLEKVSTSPDTDGQVRGRQSHP